MGLAVKSGGPDFIMNQELIVTFNRDEIIQALTNYFDSTKGLDGDLVVQDIELEEQADNIISIILTFKEY